MPYEPGLVDANVLVYALDTRSSQYSAASTLLDAARIGPTALYVTSQIICEVYSIITNARRVSNPRPSADALSVVSELCGFLHVLPAPVHAVDTLIELIRRCPVKGAEIFDLQIVANMIANGVLRIYTFNPSDFQRFSELEVLTP